MAKASRALRGRMRSVQNTRKITRTMELVSTSKLKRAQDRVVSARPYAAALADVIAELVSPELAQRFPLLRRPAPPEKGGPRRAAVLLVTSNRGLCGGFNSNLIKETRRRIEALEGKGFEVELHLVGKKGIGFFKYVGRAIASQRIDIGDRPAAAHAGELVTPLIDAFAAGRLASLDIVYARFNSPLSTPPTLLGILPWTVGLGLAGYGLGESWDTIERFFAPLAVAAAVLLVGGIAWWVWRRTGERAEETAER